MSDIFKFNITDQKPLEEKLLNLNLPFEDFLKNDDTISTTKFMG